MCEQCHEAYQKVIEIEARVNLLHEAVADILYELMKKEAENEQKILAV